MNNMRVPYSLPLEEIITTLRMGPAIADRVRRLNPAFIPAGTLLKGIRRKGEYEPGFITGRVFRRKQLTPKQQSHLYKIPKEHVIMRGKRKFYRLADVEYYCKEI